MISCKEVVKTISSEDRKTWRRNIQVQLHLMICRHCGKYAKQLVLLKAGIQKIFSDNLNSSDKLKIKEVENRIIEKMKEKK